MKPQGTVLALAAVALAAVPAHAQAGLKPFEAPAAGFRVSSPGPMRLKKKAFHGGEYERTQQVYTVVSRGAEYAVTCIDVDPEFARVLNPKQFITAAMDRVIKDSGGEVIARYKTKLSGVGAEEIRVRKGSDSLLVVRGAFVGTRIYAVGVDGNKHTVATPNTARFLNSFTLLKTASAKRAPLANVKAPRPQVRSVARLSIAAQERADIGWGEEESAPTASAAAGKQPAARRHPLARSGKSLPGQLTSKQKGAVSYKSGWVQFPAGVASRTHPRLLMDQVRNGLLERMKGWLTKDETFVKDGHLGTELRMVTPDNQSYLVRLHAVKNRVYQVGVLSPADQSYSDEMVRFLESYRVPRQ